MGWKAIADWKEPITFVRIVKGRRFFPLDVKLKLRADHWSEGAARVATRQGLQAKSFAKAAESYSDATGSSMSSDSVRRITEGFGQVLEDKRVNEAQQVYAAKVPQSAQQVVTVVAPIKEQANISTDGGMVLLREEGWKEFKMSVFSSYPTLLFSRWLSSSEPCVEPVETVAKSVSKPHLQPISK